MQAHASESHGDGGVVHVRKQATVETFGVLVECLEGFAQGRRRALGDGDRLQRSVCGRGDR